MPVTLVQTQRITGTDWLPAEAQVQRYHFKEIRQKVTE